jgi:hypothetical protein
MGVSGQHHAPAVLYRRGKDPPVPIVQEAGWAPEPVWTQRLEEKSSASVGDRTPVVQSVVKLSYPGPCLYGTGTITNMATKWKCDVIGIGKFKVVRICTSGTVQKSVAKSQNYWYSWPILHSSNTTNLQPVDGCKTTVFTEYNTTKIDANIRAV